MLNTSDWKELLLSDTFDIREGKRLTKENQTMGDTPFIGVTTKNNGIAPYIRQGYLYEGNTISLTYNDSVGEAFYQPKPFWASDNVNVLCPKDFALAENIVLFFYVILWLEKQTQSYVRKWNLEKMNDTSVRLPVDSYNEPDCRMIETYMAGLKADITNIPNYFPNEGYEKTSWYLDNAGQEILESKFVGVTVKKEITLSDRRWDKFILENTVESVQNGESYNASGLVSAADGTDYVFYVTRTDSSNGIPMHVQPEEYDGLEKASAITIGDTTVTTSLQDHDPIAGPHIIVIRTDQLDVYTANFIITLLNQEKYRYPVLGRAFTKDLVATTELDLPVDDKGSLDHQFTEDYVKSLPLNAKVQGGIIYGRNLSGICSLCLLFRYGH